MFVLFVLIFSSRTIQFYKSMPTLILLLGLLLELTCKLPFLSQTIADKAHLFLFREIMTSSILSKITSKCLPKTLLTPVVTNF